MVSRGAVDRRAAIKNLGMFGQTTGPASPSSAFSTADVAILTARRKALKDDVGAAVGGLTMCAVEWGRFVGNAVSTQ
jgi:hypothetical protein